MRLLCACLSLMALDVFADVTWASEVELGAVFTGGNTEQETLKFRFDTRRDSEKYVNTFHADLFNAAEDGNATAEKNYLFYRLGKKLGDDRGLFARLGYERDRFSGFDSQIDFTAGYNLTLLNRENLTLVTDFGIGMRRSELESDETEAETIGRIAGLYTWYISTNAIFKQSLGFEIGEEFVTSRSESSLESSISGNLAMKITLKVKHNSEVLPGKEKTDTESTVTLVYKF